MGINRNVLRTRSGGATARPQRADAAATRGARARAEALPSPGARLPCCRTRAISSSRSLRSSTDCMLRPRPASVVCLNWALMAACVVGAVCEKGRRGRAGGGTKGWLRRPFRWGVRGSKGWVRKVWARRARGCALTCTGGDAQRGVGAGRCCRRRRCTMPAAKALVV